jgi:hypothetical protein
MAKEKLSSKKPAKADETLIDANDVAAEAAEAASEVKTGPRQSRIYKGTQQIDHDLFKLKVALMTKNVSFTDRPELVEFEHCHIFHTYDSNGKKQDTCSAVGGHFHPIVVRQGKDGVPVIEVGPPRKWVLKRIRGRNQRVMAPIDLGDTDKNGNPLFDEHTHEVDYLGSERITLRQSNVEFAKMEASIKARQEPSIDGVESR